MQFRRAPGVIYDELDGHAVLLDRAAVRMLTLNPVGTLVWQLLDDDRTCAELTTLLLPKVRGVTAEQLESSTSRRSWTNWWRPAWSVTSDERS